MKRTSRLQAALGLALFSALLAGPASALSMLPDPLTIVADTGAVFDLTLVSVETGLPAGGVIGLGTVGAGMTTLVFQVSVTAGPYTGHAVIIDGFNQSGVGFVPGTGEELSIGTLVFPIAAGFFAPLGSPLLAGEVTTQFFISLDVPASSLVGAELNFVSFDAVTGPSGSALAVLVPEPTTATLFGLSIALLGGCRRLRARMG